ncbi:putative iron-regulated membrane protein [Luteibacter sp. Sphag1AF]|uniref:PepSY-associated TM helix domain-containing protein n=1 Tax=Luteibacter sp. Sphag1AF TaxID=2587031 RepID=UPI00161FB3E7|nr:PepSY-associated TM helix domain-containing protein [Luteibacter sp. Sphag1AF]MBB3226676.1 putative iron-regulated membrane protein [Luteibacter sp. Sphag1AF]
MKAATIRTFTTVHTWTGLLAGFALFIAFYAGALTMFHDEIDVWAVPHSSEAAADTMDRAHRMLDGIVATSPAAKEQIGVTLPGNHPSHHIAAYWFDKEWKTQSLTDAAPTSSEDHEHGLADFVYELHYTLGIPVAGIYFMGVISIIYGLALLTGLLIHLPHLVRELAALRPGHNLKRLWQDAHNVIGILSLPFHIIFAVTGALLCLSLVTLLAFDRLAFDGKLAPASEQMTSAMPDIKPLGRPAVMLSPQELAARARQAALAAGAADFEPDYMSYKHYGDAGAGAEVRGTSTKTLGEYGMVALSAVDGKVLAIQVAGKRDANHATYSGMFGLHFGTFGNVTVRWLYFLLGLAGAFLFYSGNLLYIETRRKRRQADQPLKVRAMATATVGVCIGSCLAISAAFVANVVSPFLGSRPEAVVQPVCFGVFAAAVAWTLLRRPARAAVELLWATALLSLATAVLDITLHHDRLLRSMAEGEWAVAGVDAVAIAMAVGFGWLAVATRRRTIEGDPNSVWAGSGRAPEKLVEHVA